MTAARKSTKSTRVGLPAAQRREDFARSHSVYPHLQGLEDATQRGGTQINRVKHLLCIGCFIIARRLIYHVSQVLLPISV